jgi:hypothetical protein
VSIVTASIAAGVVSRAVWLAVVWLRLRAQARRDEAHLRYLALALTVPADRDLVHVAADGTRLHLSRVTRSSRAEGTAGRDR